MILWLYFYSSGKTKDTSWWGNGIFSTEVVSIKWDIWWEKEGFFNNPKVINLLEKNGVKLDIKKEGSITMVQNPTIWKDFLSPSTNIATELYKASWWKLSKTDTIFYSPLVIYSWKNNIDVFEKIWLVKKDVDHYIIDLKKITELIMKDTKISDLWIVWDDRYLKIYSTDPTKSNSWNMFAWLIYSILWWDGANINQQILEQLWIFFDKMWFTLWSSSDIFKNFLNKWESMMMVVWYENQLIEFYNENPEYQDYIKNNIVILYPNPTVWAEHEIISLNEKWDKLIDLLENKKEFKDIASKEHWFRIMWEIKWTVSISNIAKKITNIISLPSFKVVNDIITFLEKRNNY